MSILSRIFGGTTPGTPDLPSPREIGLILACSLIEGGDPNDLSPAEAKFLDAENIPRVGYVQERFLLRACAANASILTSIPAGPIRRQVEEGYMQWFADNAQRSQLNAVMLALYVKRLPAYLTAAEKDAQSQDEADALNFSAVGGVFADALVQRSEAAGQTRGQCDFFADLIARALWSGQIEGAKALFRRGRLIA